MSCQLTLNCKGCTWQEDLTTVQSVHHLLPMLAVPVVVGQGSCSVGGQACSGSDVLQAHGGSHAGREH